MPPGLGIKAPRNLPHGNLALRSVEDNSIPEKLGQGGVLAKVSTKLGIHSLPERSVKKACEWRLYEAQDIPQARPVKKKTQLARQSPSSPHGHLQAETSRQP